MTEGCWYRDYRAWRCTRNPGHPGPCALRPKWWNFVEWGIRVWLRSDRG